MTFFRMLRLIGLMGLATLMAVVAIWIFVDRPAAEKVATSLAQPCGIVWYMLIAATIMAWRHSERGVAVWVTATCLAYTLVGNGFFSEAAMRSLERPFYDSRPLQEQPFDAIILLGGGASLTPTDRSQGNCSGDRVILAAEMFHAGLTPTIVCCGARIPSVDSSTRSPSENSIAVLKRLGVPETVIRKTEGRNTSEELQQVKQLYAKGEARLGLVTSAWHLPRTLKLAAACDVNVQPLPADFKTGPRRPKATGESILFCIPSADAMSGLAAAMKEYLGMLVRR